MLHRALISSSMHFAKVLALTRHWAAKPCSKAALAIGLEFGEFGAHLILGSDGVFMNNFTAPASPQ